MNMTSGRNDSTMLARKGDEAGLMREPEKDVNNTSKMTIKETKRQARRVTKTIPPSKPRSKSIVDSWTYWRRRPTYRQYIYDRISGNSYIPRSERGKVDPKKKSSPREGVGAESSDEDEERPTFSNDGEEDSDDEEDPTDCVNRPPHFLCYVPPCVRRCPICMEQNRVCERMGRIGCHCFNLKTHHHARRRIFIVGFTFNLAALCLTIVAAMAFSINYNLLTSTSFSRGEITVPAWGDDVKATLNVGFRAVALDDPHGIVGGEQTVSTFNDFCDANGRDVGEVEQLLSHGLCGDCRDSSFNFIVSCVINMILILRNMFSDITRMYPRYDLNCPNFHGSLLATFSVLLGIWTIGVYQSACFANIEQDLQQPYYIGNFTESAGGEATDGTPRADPLLIKFEWGNGPGLDCLFVATVLRFVDAICNYIVPTPSITRNMKERREYELKYGELRRTQSLMLVVGDDDEYIDGAGGDGSEIPYDQNDVMGRYPPRPAAGSSRVTVSGEFTLPADSSRTFPAESSRTFQSERMAI